MSDIDNQIGVRVTYRDKDLRPTYTKTYTLGEYTAMLRNDLLKVITDIENLGYIANGNKGKEDWSDETFSLFNRIKHKILDKSGEIGRMPENIIIQESASRVLAALLGEGVNNDGKSMLGSQN